MTTATMTSKGQLTIPKDVRDALKLKAGDRVEIRVRDGEARLTPVCREAREVYGMLARPGQKAVTAEDMDRRLAQSFKRKRA
jgi:antitoxin PrlF